MLKSTSCVERILRWFRRFRHRCGYGIHSPFAFNLVTGVIYEKGVYYAYDELARLASDSDSALRLKDYRLLFRLANHQQPSNGCVVGTSDALLKSYLKRGCRNSHWSSFSSFDVKTLVAQSGDGTSFDFIYIDDVNNLEAWLSALLPFVTDRTLVVVRGIYRDDAFLTAWRNWLHDDRIRVSFDLYDFGLAFFESRLNKENYMINYF